MSSQFPTHQDMSYQSVYFKIWIDGKPLSPFENTLVEEVTYEDTSTGSDLVSITVHDPDFVIIGNPKITKSTPCKVEAGFKTKYRTWIDGYISAVDVEFPQEGVPLMVIHVMDKSYIMNRVERKKVYKNMTYSAIAKKLAQSYGLSFEGDTSGEGSKVHETVTQSFETDIQFLIGLANEIGYLVYVDSAKNKLFFKDKDKFTNRASFDTLWYRKPPFDVLSFRPRVIQADQLNEITESDIDNKTKEETSGGVTNETNSNDSGGSSGNSGSGNSGEEDMMVYDPYTGKWTKKSG